MADTAPESTPVTSETPASEPAVETPDVPMTDAPPDDGSPIYNAEPDYSHLEPKPAAEPVAEVVPEPESVAPLTEQHYQWGQYLGLSQAHVDAMPREALESLIHSTNARIQQQRQWQQAVQQQQRQPTQPQQHPQQPWAFQPIQPPAPIEPIVIPPEQREQYDPIVLQAIDRQNAAIQAQNAQNQHFQQLQGYVNVMALQHQQLQAVQQREVEDRAAEAQYREFEDALSKLDPDEFGNGRRAELTDQKHRVNYDMVEQQVRRIAAGHRGVGEEVPPIPVMVKAAYAQLFGDKIRTNTISEVAAKAKERRAQVTAKPTQRRQRPMTEDESARQVVANWLAENRPAQELATAS